jgi:UDP:flavonoid glycosyltransferase YjiC (YdhE family)
MTLTETDLYLSLSESIHSRIHRDRRDKHKIIKRLGLKSYGATRDSAHFPPHWEDDNCVAGIHFNTPGMIDCPKQSSKFVFVGAGVSKEPELPTTTFPELEWMDDAALHGHDVVYINMGSMFIWESDEFRACIKGFEAAHRNMGGRVRFLIKINGRPRSRHTPRHSTTITTGSSPDQKEVKLEDELPPYIRLTSWIQHQQSIYTHSALKAFVHHGGGNSFNEAVHFAIPQLVLSQWLDTHEYGLYAEKFGLGLRSRNPPRIEADDIRLKIETLLGPKWDGYKSNCRAWAFRSQIAGGPAAAAKIVLFHAENERKMPTKRVSNATDSGMEMELTPPLSPVLGEKDGTGSGAVKEIVL